MTTVGDDQISRDPYGHLVISVVKHTFPTAASPSSTSLTLLDGLGVLGVESAIKDTGESNS